jgi:hypothetical protein
MKHIHDDHLVADGLDRARSANLGAIQAEVERAYAERLQSAGFFRGWLLRCEMRREIQRRLDRVAPPWGLYFSS